MSEVAEVFDPYETILKDASFRKEDLTLDGLYFLDLIEPRDAQERHLTAMVPVEMINPDDVPTDPENLEHLRELMAQHAAKNGGVGQMDPVILGHIPELGRFEIINGFHRYQLITEMAQAAKERNEPLPILIKAEILINSNREEVRDWQISYAAEHDRVRLARAYRWIQEAWEDTAWHGRVDVDLAFRWAEDDSEHANSALTAYELAELRGWVNQKSKIWKLKPGTINRYLRIGARLDMNLIEHYGVKNPEGILTHSQFDVIGDVLEGQTEFQWLVASFAARTGTKDVELRSLAYDVVLCETAEEAAAIIKQFEFGETDEPAPSRIATYKGYSGGGTKPSSPSPPPPPPPPTPVATEESGGRNYATNEQLFEVEIDTARLALSALVLRGFAPARLGTPRVEGLMSGDNQKSTLAEIGVNAYPLLDKQMLDRGIAYLQSLQPTLIERCRNRFDQNGAESIVRSVCQRITEDMRWGALSYVPLSAPSQLNRVVEVCLADEVRLRDFYRVKGVAYEPPTTGEVDLSAQWLASSKLQKLKRTLSTLSSKDRRVIILRTVFGLSSFVVAQAVNDKTERIDNFIEAMEADVTSTDASERVVQIRQSLEELNVA